MDTEFLQQLGLKQGKFILYYDSISTIYLIKNPILHSRTKYIDVKYHLIKEKLEEKLFLFENVHTDGIESE